jgi:hypothetical protein
LLEDVEELPFALLLLFFAELLFLAVPEPDLELLELVPVFVVLSVPSSAASFFALEELLFLDPLFFFSASSWRFGDFRGRLTP